MDFLTNPWVIITIVLCVVVGNIMVLKYTAKMKTRQMKRDLPSTPESTPDSSQDDADSERKNPPN